MANLKTTAVMKKLLCFLMLGTSLSGFSQNQSWIFAPNYKQDMGDLNFPIPLPTTPGGYQGQPATGAQNIINNSNDEILFFIVDETIYGRSGEVIALLEPGIQNINGQIKGRNAEVVVIPDASDCNMFHLLSTRVSLGSIEVAKGFYAKLRISYNSQGQLNANSGLVFEDYYDCYSNVHGIKEMVGTAFNSANGGPGNPHDEAPYYAVAPLDANGIQKIYVKNATRIFVFSISNGTFSYDNVFYELAGVPNAIFSTLSNLSASGSMRTEFEVIRLASGNLRFACILEDFRYTGSGINYDGVGIFDLNMSGNLVPGSAKICAYEHSLFTIPSQQLQFSRITGIELSPLGNNVFISHLAYSPTNSSLDSWNITAVPSKTVISSNAEYQFSQIEMAANGKAYIPKQHYLSGIDNVEAIPVLNANEISNANYAAATIDDANQVRLLQDQIDGQSFAALAPSVTNAYVYEVTTSGTWSPNTIPNSYNNNPLIYGVGNTAVIEKELRIKAGVTLTINNLNIEFAPGARLVVENAGSGQGGRLILNNCLLTNAKACGSNELWLGVEVWGNQNLSQGSILSSTQGRLQMNNSTIENAWVGVLVSKRNSSLGMASNNSAFCDATAPLAYTSVVQLFSFDNARNGGIVRTSNSRFVNNQRGVWFRPYVAANGANNQSVFNLTSFDWDANLLTSVQSHIRLETVKGISIKGCSFQNNITYPNNNLAGQGILSTESQFFVTPFCPVLVPAGQPCQGQTPNEFSNLFTAIRAINGNDFTFSCRESNFINNRYGIHVTGTKGERIQLNNFEIYESDVLQSIGIALYNSTGYYVQENLLTNADNPAVDLDAVNSYGIVVSNSGENTNEIYKNDFHNLRVGGHTQRINAVEIDPNNVPDDAFSIKGLQWRCNDFQSDIYEHDMELISGRMHPNQGYAYNASTYDDAKRNAANNKFSLLAEGMNPPHDFFISDFSQGINYVHLSIPRHTPDSYTFANNLSGNIMSVQPIAYGGTYIQEDAGACPSKISKKIVGTSLPMVWKYRNEIDSLRNLIDGGNTTDLLDLIENASPGQVKNGLIAASPYLSDDVLLRYIQSQPPVGHLRQVLLANSHLSHQVKSALVNYAMPNGIANQIAAAQTGVSERSKLYENINQRIYLMDLEYEDLISQLLLDDSDAATIENVIGVLREFEDYERLKRILSMYVSFNDTVRSAEVRQEIIQMNPCPYFMELCDIQEEIGTKRCPAEAISADSTLLQRLTILSVNSTDKEVAHSAECLINYYYNIDAEPEILTAASNQRSSESEQQTIVEEIDLFRSESDHFYPNPTDGISWVDINFSDFEKVELIVATLDGKIEQQKTYLSTFDGQIDLTDLSKGIYLVIIKGDGQAVHQGKIERK
jgi:hypothetical protein